jgi:hypothetical protein
MVMEYAEYCYLPGAERIRVLRENPELLRELVAADARFPARVSLE